MQALLDAQPKLNIVHVLSNRKAAYGLQRAQSATPSVPTSVFALKPYLTANPGKSREDYDRDLAKLVVDQRPDLIVLAGWMHILSNSFLEGLRHAETKLPQSAASPNDAPEKSASSSPEERAKIPIINLHPALPGAFDGANAIHRAWEASQKGEITKTGVMVHEVVAEVDRGQPILVKEVDCIQGESVEALEARMHAVEHDLLVQATQKVARDIEGQK